MKQDHQQDQTTIIEEQKDHFGRIITKTKCQKQKLGYFACMNKVCQQKNVFICQDKTCQCKSLHNKCIKVQIENLVYTIQKSAFSFNKIQQKVKNIFQNIIDKLSQMEDKIMLEFSQLFASQAYSSQQRLFLSQIQSNSELKITSDTIYKIHSEVYDRKIREKKASDVFQSLESISIKLTQLTQEANSFYQKIKRKLLQLQNIYTDKQKQAALGLFQSSKIICSIQDEKILINFFPQTIINAESLYCASKQKFQKTAFHKLCEDIENILILIRTEKDKIIGGYTPLAFSSQYRQTWLEDDKAKSFIFSLTQKDKFKLINSQHSIWNGDLDKLPVCGFGDDIVIANKANQNEKSSINFSKQRSYQHENYPQNSSSYQKFTGSYDKYFKIKEWQVWKLTVFDTKKQI